MYRINKKINNYTNVSIFSSEVFFSLVFERSVVGKMAAGEEMRRSHRRVGRFG